MARIKAILFDLGNTVIDFGRVNTLRMFSLGARHAYGYLQGLDKPLPAFRRFHRRQLWAVRWRYFVSRLTRREFNSLDVLRHLSERMGHRLTPEQTEELAWRWYMPLSRAASIEEGIHHVLAALRDAGLAMAVVSNTFVPGQVLDRHLKDLGLLEFFPVRVYSCDVGFRKPHSGIFRIVMERVGVSGREAIFVGDSVKADVAGAARAGMISVLKDASGRRRVGRVRPKHRIRSLRELPGIVASYNSP